MLHEITPKTLHDTVLARLETRWQAPWLIAGFSHWGHGHAEDGLPNQDAFACGAIGRTTWLAVADGVSAAPRSGEGAALAVQEVGAEIERSIKSKRRFDGRSLSSCIEAVRRRIAFHANRQKRQTVDFATTLLVAVLSETSLTVAKIGDGYVLGLEQQRDKAVLVPLAESALPHLGSEVVDLTHTSWKDQLAVRHIEDRVAAGIHTVALGTDGCSRFFHKAATLPDGTGRTVALNAELIDGHFASNLGRLGARNLFAYVAGLMGHRQFVDEGDDRTLLIASLHQGSGPPCFPSTA